MTERGEREKGKEREAEQEGVCVCVEGRLSRTDPPLAFSPNERATDAPSRLNCAEPGKEADQRTGREGGQGCNFARRGKGKGKGRESMSPNSGQRTGSYTHQVKTERTTV